MSRDYLQMLLVLLGFAAVFGSKWFADEWTQTLPLQIAVKNCFQLFWFWKFGVQRWQIEKSYLCQIIWQW